MYLLKCESCGIATTHEKNYIFENRKGSNDWLLMCFNTDFEYFDGSTVRIGRKYQCLLNAPGTPLIHGPLKNMNAGFENDWIFFSGNCIAELIKELELPVGVSFDATNSNCLTDFIDAVIKEQKMPMYFSEHHISQTIVSMLVSVARHAKTFEYRNSDAYVAIENVRAVMLKNYKEHHTLQSLADSCRYSVSRFCELYKAFYGSSPILDLNNLRINKAKQLLLSTDMSIGQICEYCGFDSIHYFSNRFTKSVGCSPSKYRQNRTDK